MQDLSKLAERDSLRDVARLLTEEVVAQIELEAERAKAAKNQCVIDLTTEEPSSPIVTSHSA